MKNKIILVFIVIAVIAGILQSQELFIRKKDSNNQSAIKASDNKLENVEKSVIDNINLESNKLFTGPEFADLYESVAYPSTEQILIAPEITSDKNTNELIGNVAKSRGYKLRSFPTSELVEVDPGIFLQKIAQADLYSLTTDAENEDIKIRIVAGYRSVEDQKDIFLSRIKSFDQPSIDELLATTSPPAYSRHHTGYTVDFGCGDVDVVIFVQSICFDWLSKNNYANSKKHGWIPSYPDGAGLQGPDPEPWEYVWVGKKSINNYNNNL